MHKYIFAAAIAALSFSATLPAVAGTSVTVAGSTALLPLVKEAAGEYQGRHPDVSISVQGGGSYQGIRLASSGSVDIGNSDVIAPGNSGLVDHKIAVVGFAIVANPNTGVGTLSRKQIRDIFAGRISNWRQVGGHDQGIVIINRPRSSGTRAVFNATIMGTSRINESGLVEDSSGQVVQTVAQTPGAVSYVAFSYMRKANVTVLSIDRVAATEDNVRSGRYPIWSYEHMFTRPHANRAAEDFVNYVRGRTDLAAKLGFVAISSMRVRETNR